MDLMPRQRLHDFQAYCQQHKWQLILAISTFLFILTFILAIALNARSVKTMKSLCTTKTCVNSASDILNSMDLSVDPCVDFYHFACGGFKRSAVLPDHKKTVDAFTKMDGLIRQQMKLALEEPVVSRDPKFVRLVKNLFKSCTNITTLKQAKIGPLLNIVKSLGGWPVREGRDWNASEFNWQQWDYKLRKIGFRPQYLVHLSITVDPTDITRFILLLQDPVLRVRPEIGNENRLRDNTNMAYFRHMTNVAVSLGATRSNAESELNASFKFETQLQRIVMESENLQALSPHQRMTIKELTAACPSVEWLDYVNNLLPQGMQIDEKAMVIVHLKYLQKFEALIQNTSKRILANYLVWRALDTASDHLNPNLMREKGYARRWQYCHARVQTLLPICTSALYVRRYFNQKIMTDVRTMSENIKYQLHKTIRAANWLDGGSRRSALRKLEEMRILIGAPDHVLDFQFVDKYHAHLELDGDNYLLNFLNVSRFDIDETFKRLGKTVHDSSISDNFNNIVTSANAMYYLAGNSVIVSAALMQDVFYNVGRPQFLNYGAIGAVIGHEMNHAFHGTEDPYVNLRKVCDWWTGSIKDTLATKKKCFVNQYSNYTVKEVNMKINGSVTLNENIADNGGFKISYLAYTQWAAKHGPDPMLPGLPFTERQMFWISAARPFCSKHNPEYIKHLIELDTHTVKEFRVLGTFSNVPEFAADFQCSADAPMNPVKKCYFW